MSKYNGCTNYETWNYMLWIDNKHESQKFWQAKTKKLAEKYTDAKTNSTDRTAVIYDLAKALEADIEEAAYSLCETASCLNDLLSHAIHRINFGEIAEHLYEDYIQEEEHGN